MRQPCCHCSSLDYDTLYRLTSECKSLRELVQTLQDANSQLEKECLRKEPSLASSAVSQGQPGPERSLEEAEEKIAGLLQVKEKLVNVQVISRPSNVSLLITKYFCPGGEGEAGGRRDEAGGGTFYHSCGQQNSHSLHSHSHHRLVDNTI